MIHRHRQSGQSLVIALGLFALAGVSLFMVLNSHRAVDEKMNLVNAADAAAFSGAQMAARELNFMALTNRTMVANEVAIGHMMAYQVEVDLTASVLKGGFTGLLGQVYNGVMAIFGGAATIDAANSISRAWSGVYMLGVAGQNAGYQSQQESEFQQLAGIGKDSIINTIMSNVAAKYVAQPNVTNAQILVNDPATLAKFAASTDTDTANAAKAAQVNPFCAMVMFAAPSSNTTSGVYGQYVNNPSNPNDYKSTAIYQQCQQYYQTGAIPGSPGSVGNAIADGGQLVELLNASAKASPAGKWVLNRDADYSILGVGIQRRGQSQALFDTANNQINWKTVGPDTIKDTGGLLSWLLFGFSGQATGDARAYAEQGGAMMGFFQGLLRGAGMCDDDPKTSLQDCDKVPTHYESIKRYAILNPMMLDPQPVTAFLTQRGNCNDDLGINASGIGISGWHTDQKRFGSQSFCSDAKEVYAYSQAKVFYQRPCTDDLCTQGYNSKKVVSETPNLFNPFWQAKLGN